MRRILMGALFLTIAVNPHVQAQTGPGGVGNSDGSASQPRNIIWLDASTITSADGSDILTWQDQSGNENNVTALSAISPILRYSGPNGLSYAEFSKSNTRMVINPFDDMPDRELTVYLVFKTTGNDEGMVSYAVSGSDNEFLLFKNNSRSIYIDGSANSTGVAYNSGSWLVNSMKWRSSDGSLNSFLNSALVNSTTHKTGASLTNGGALAIGGEQDAVNGGFDASQAFKGDLAEVIIFDSYINEAQRIIVDNYLNAKYDITMASNDYYAGDDSGNGDYDSDIIGIGQSNGDQHADAAGAGLRILPEGSSLDQNNEFVLAGHTTPTNSTTTANVGTGIEQRWLRSWYIDKSGTLGATLGFNFQTGLEGDYPANNVDYRLLKWDGSAFEPVSVSSISISGYELRFELTDAQLTDGIYTIGTTDVTNAPLTGVSNKIWYSYQTGDWSDPDTWTLDGSTTPTYVNPSAEIPSDIDDVVITNGRTVSMDLDNVTAASLEVLGTFDANNTTGQDFSVIKGNGVIKIGGAPDQTENFPQGDLSFFANPLTGGTLELNGNTDIILDQPRTFNNVKLDFNSPTVAAILLNDWIINGDLTIETGTFQINDNSSTTGLTIQTKGDVVINSSGKITTGTANTRHEFNFYGDLLNNGGEIEFTNRAAVDYSNEATDGIVDANFINSTSNQTIKCDGTSVFYRIEIDKGEDQTYILDIDASNTANFQLFGPADYGHGSTSQLNTNDNSLGLLKGTVRLNTNVVVPRLNTTGNYNISEAARIWVNGGAVTKTGGTALVIYGTIQLSGGTIDVPVSSGLTTRDNGNIIISGGVMTVNQIRTSIEGVENTGGYSQSGGTVNITGGSYSTDYYVFSLTYPGNTFTMSGGTLHVKGTSGGGPSGRQGGIFINSIDGNYSVTGGTVIMDNSSNQNFKVTSTSPFWNVILRHSGGSSTEVELDEGTSGDPGAGKFTSLSNPTLRILNDLTIESGVTLDHNGYNVEIGANFTIQDGGDYLFNNGKKNTTTINGTSNSLLSFYNRTGDTNDEQRFWNFVINKPQNKTVTLESGKADRTANNNNLLRIDGNYFKLLSGTLDNGSHSIRFYTDTLVNYQQVGNYIPANADPDETSNGDNDLIKFRPDDFVLITADTSVFGNVRLNNAAKIVTLNSDVYMQRLDYRNGRIDLGENKLTLDNLDIRLSSGQTRTDEDPQGNFSVEDMLIMAGNASDGGLSLHIPAGGDNPGFINIDGIGKTNQEPKLYIFPIGTGSTGSDTDSEFTPVSMTLASASDDGYINVKVVKHKLPTAGPYPLGNDVSDRYWIVDYEGFTTVPKIEQMWFRSVERDDPNGGATGFPANYVPGKVLDDAPFTRSSEIKGSAPSTSGFVTDDAQDLRIYFWGNAGSGNPSGGFDLINAAYTAGDPSKFVGAPTVFYTRNNGNRIWTDNTKWTTNANGSDDGLTSIPGTGDVVVARNYGQSNQNAWVYLNIDISIAKLIFDNSFGGYGPRVWITKRDALANLGIVSGAGTVYVEHTVSQQPDFTGSDFGLFAAEEKSFFDFKADADNSNPVPLPTNITTYPNLRIEGGSGDFNKRITQNTVPITINNDLWIDYGGTFSAGNDIHIKGSLLVGRGGGNKGLFEIYDQAVITVDIDGDLELTTNATEPRFTVRNTNLNSLQHIIKVGGNLIVQKGTLDLYNGTGTNNNALLQFDGSGDVSFSRAAGNVPDIYRLEVNKSGNLDDVVDIQTDILLNGTTNTSDKAIILTRGKLRLNNSALDLDLTTSGNFTIPGTAGLQIIQGIANVRGDDSGILLDGSIEIDGGTLNMDDASGNGNNFIEYSSSGNALIEISSGTLLVGSQLRPLLTAETGVLTYRQSGGDVHLGINAAPQNNRGVLQIYNSGSEFTYTGGTLTLSRHQNTPTVAALYLNPESSNVTGAITIFDTNTPTSQSDFRINSSIELADLIIHNTNNPTARLDVNPLTLRGQLTIQSGATLDADALTLTLKSDFVNDGTYLPDNNTTIFQSDADQSFSGSGTGDFYNFTKDGTGKLTLSKDVISNGLLSITAGIINDGGNNLIAKANVLLDGLLESTTTSSGLEFSGTLSQQLYRSSAGTGNMGTVTINNSAGIVIPDGNGFDFNINKALRMQSGVFNIGGALLTIGQLADIIPVNAFAVTNMIQTNSSFTDNGVKKIFQANYSSNFIFPVGELLFTPVAFDFSSGSNTFGTTTGSITVRPSAEYHPTINDGSDYFATGDINNVLQYYWILDANSANGFTSDVLFYYDQTDVKTDEPGYDESDYIPAQILSNNNPTNSINKFSVNQVNETLNTISFSYNGVTDNGVSGDYFAGIDEAIPNNVTTYTSVSNGNVDEVIYDQIVPGGGAPNGAVLRVANGTTVSFNINGVNLYKTEIEAGGVLEINQTTQHRLGIVTGQGTLRIVSDNNNANLPAGYYANYFTCSGGGLEYAGSGSYSILSGIKTLRHLIVSGSGDRTIANNDVYICNDLTINGGTVLGNSQNKITVNNDLTINGGSLITPTGTNGRIIINGDLHVNGGLYKGATSSGTTSIAGNLIIDGGTFDVGGQSYRVLLRGNLTRSSGSFQNGTSNAYVGFLGNSQQTVTGDFTSSNAWRKIQINNGAGVKLNGDVDINNELTLQSGRLITSSNRLYLTTSGSVSPATGKSNSYIDGKLYKDIPSGQSFTFPIGKGSVWRYVSVNSTSSGTHTWEAEYFPADPVSNPLVDNHTATDPIVVNISKGEYWVISDGNVASSGVTATLGLSWGMSSDVAPSAPDREKLKVMVWNDGSSSWDNYGGINFSSGHTQSNGYFTTESPLGFSEHIVTLGSTDLSNPLPITLDYFKGKNAGTSNIIEWGTVAEINNSYFELQRSSDGESYTSVYSIKGAGTTYTAQYYRYTDTHPDAGVNYYRLKQVDLNGEYSYSNQIIRLYNDSAPAFLEIKPFPNPTKQENINVSIKDNLSGSALIRMTDMYGKQVFEKIYDANDTIEPVKILIYQSMPQGIYLLTVQKGLHTVTQKVVITE